MKLRILLVASIALLASANVSARLGEIEAELVTRFGSPTGRSNHSIYAQGKSIQMGPVLVFRQDDWSISCDLIDGRCVRINYSKRGDWSEEQIQLVLTSNSQGAKWELTSKPSANRYHRTWRRTDGSYADWRPTGMSLTWDAYEKAKAKAEEAARVAAMQKPKI